MQAPRIVVTQELLQLVAEVDEFKGRWEALKSMFPERLRYNNERPNMGFGGITPKQKMALMA
jgi:hypothetical protein